MKTAKKLLIIILTVIMLVSALSGCGTGAVKVKLDPKNPTTITVWHYYNGAVMTAFDQLTKEFNDTIGVEQGIIVQGSSMGNVSDLQAAVLASAKKEVGSQEMPNIFASYADTAYAAEQMGILADIGQYFSQAELNEYIDAYIDEGRIGANNELKIFPIAKSTEILMINETDWTDFAAQYGHDYNTLATHEGIAAVAKDYYEWSGGKAFFGRDAIANMFIIGAMQLNAEIIKVDKGAVTVNVDKEAMRKIWNTYYLPYISGYFLSAGRYRSDDTKVGDLIAYVGSTSSAMYFPAEVTSNGNTYPVTAAILPPPVFEGGKNVMVQQGAGMAVTQSTPEKEYASAVFLKWFTDNETNIQFSALSGYMPVKKEANHYDLFMSVVNENNIPQDEISKRTLEVAFEAVNKSQMYTSKAYNGGMDARAILNDMLQNKAIVDRQVVIDSINGGMSHADAIAQFSTDENFENWYADLSNQMQQTAD
jgi:hypothetical protein